MKTLNVSISNIEYDSFGLTKDSFSFSEFLDIIERRLSRQALDKTIQIADMYGLSSISMDEISDEVQSVRNKR
ncbi:hypothetical protein [Viscerimonas tarda]